MPFPYFDVTRVRRRRPVSLTLFAAFASLLGQAVADSETAGTASRSSPPTPDPVARPRPSTDLSTGQVLSTSPRHQYNRPNYGHGQNKGDKDQVVVSDEFVQQICAPEASAFDVWAAVLEDLDRDDDGKLDYEEFELLWLRLPSRIRRLRDFESPIGFQDRTSSRKGVPRPGEVSSLPESASRPEDPLESAWVCDSTETLKDKIRYIFDALDEDKDGYIDIQEGEDGLFQAEFLIGVLLIVLYAGV